MHPRHDRTKFSNEVTNPLLEARWLAMTFLDNATSSLQKDRLTAVDCRQSYMVRTQTGSFSRLNRVTTSISDGAQRSDGWSLPPIDEGERFV